MLMLNWKVLAAYFKSNKAVWGVSLAVVALLAVLMAVPSTHESGGKDHVGVYRGHHK